MSNKKEVEKTNKNNETWKKFIDKNNKLRYEINQAKFYERTKNFILGDGDVLINQGGMGLGKTLATVKALNLLKNNYIATPFVQIKNEWSNELNLAKIKHAVWHSKTDCCIKHKQDVHFNISNCTDACPHREHLECNKEFTTECEIISRGITFPLNIEKYYNKNGYKDCLLPITRYKIKQSNVVVGDYFGFFIPKMFRYIMGKNQYETDLHIDEGHMLPERAKQFLSRQLSISYMIKRLLRVMEEDDYFLLNLDRKIIIEKCLEGFKNIMLHMISIFDIKDKEKIKKISYNEFILMWEKENGYKFSMFINEIIKYTKTIISKEEIDSPKAFTETFDFFKYWEEKNNDKNYNSMFQYFQYKNDDIVLKVNCSDTGDFLGERLSIFNKVHILSGTIPDKEYFKKMIGINNCIFEEPLDSYSIKNNVINYGKGNFVSKNRDDTYETSMSFLKTILKKMKGRILIYTQSKKYANILSEMLSEFNIFNLNQKTNDELSKTKEEFNKSGDGVAIGYITGKVEGQNFIDEDGIAVENIIIFGYPYVRMGIEYDDAIAHWTRKLNGNIKRAREYVGFLPMSSKIYQASMRAKRSRNDNPVILLWGKEFSPGNPGYKYAYSELKGDVVFKEKDVLKKIDKIYNGKTN